MGGVRRSGRMAKEIAILLLGTDTDGKVVAEKTKTVVLTGDGAGILSQHNFAPDETLTIRTLDSHTEAEIRLVGQIGPGTDGYIYGVAFKDPHLDFWQTDFPFPPPGQPEPAEISLECHVCHDRRTVEPSEIERYVYSINESILRHCERCGVTTTWQRANSDAAPAPSRLPRIPTSLSLRPDQPPDRPATFTDTQARVLASIPEIAAAVAALADEPVQHPASDSSAGKSDRRHHRRVRVNFTACVRHGTSGDDIVACEELSKGGLAFLSRKRYSINSLIEVAVPYSPNQTPIFVSASIKHAEEIPGGNFYRYGAAYAKSPLKSPSGR